MSIIAAVEIKFGDKRTVHSMIAPLLTGGWVFPENVINYDYYKPVWNIGSNKQQSPVGQWEQVSALLTTKVQRRYTVSLELYYPRGNFISTIYFPSLRDMRFAFFGSHPRLSGCSRYTSYTPLLESIVCPLADAGLPVLEVHCHDDDY